jgi:hypothetical protein
VLHFKQATAGFATIDNLIQTVTHTTAGKTLEPCMKLHEK